MEEKEKFLSEEEKDKLLKELADLVCELASDEFVWLYRALEKLQTRYDALFEAFYRLCDRHNLRCD